MHKKVIQFLFLNKNSIDNKAQDALTEMEI
jgi:hypothetical protein